jgi:hypothetical protein
MFKEFMRTNLQQATGYQLPTFVGTSIYILCPTKKKCKFESETFTDLRRDHSKHIIHYINHHHTVYVVMYKSGKRIQNPSLLVPQAHDGLQGATLLADSLQYKPHG